MPIYVLADGAQFPAEIAPLIAQAPAYRNVYEGMPEERAEDASLFLARIDDDPPEWMNRLDELDQKMPCISLIFSDASIDALATHFQQFLLADLSEGLTSLVRYFDPRNIAVCIELFGTEVSEQLIAPIYQWRYRGHSRHWQCTGGGARYADMLKTPVDIRLNQRQVDYLSAHSEPDQMLSSLIQRGFVDGSGFYVTRFENFIPRYRQVARWGLTAPQCRLRYCELSYQYGFAFDQHLHIRQALEARMRSGAELVECIDALPDYVWEELAAGR